MNLLKDGLIKIYHDFSILENEWDGYKAIPINKVVLNSIKNISFIMKQVKLFNIIGFQVEEINIVPMSNGNIQLEAENSNLCLMIEIDESYFNNYLEQEKVSFGEIPNKGSNDGEKRQ